MLEDEGEVTLARIVPCRAALCTSAQGEGVDKGRAALRLGPAEGAQLHAHYRVPLVLEAMAIEVHIGRLLLIGHVDKDFLLEDRYRPVRPEGHRHRLLSVGLHSARGWREREGRWAGIVRLGPDDSLQAEIELEGAIVLDHQRGGGVVLALLAVANGAHVYDPVLWLDLQHGTHAPPTDGHLYAGVLGAELQHALVDLDQLGLEIDHELEGLRRDVAGSAQHCEALVFGQRIHMQLLGLRGVQALQGEGQELPLVRCDLPKIQDGGAHSQAAGQDARPHTEVRDRLPLRVRRPTATLLTRL
mmetsp:Transcript_93654/g.200883  ORF Transcript_93654/g.200883 Transcript_93654/m.200883 type:complete len:301 (-) Transcript_93654:3640-4542(-)